jgi:hypothetical protein
MARYSYDVNTTTRYIDVHKQFNGGLKTVDTDDALGAVFLRDAENVSLSEFGFIEKRYGTYEKAAQQLSGNLQGYWEFLGRKIYAINGVFHIDGSSPIDDFYLENADYRYPAAASLGFTDNTTYYTGTLQTTRQMNAVVKNDVLYIFTGTYPIYVKEVGGALKFFLMPVEVPNYDEIVVTGHNLLEDDYDNVYEFDGSNFSTNTTGNFLDPEFYVRKTNWFPQFPYVEEVDTTDTNANKLNFEIAYNIDGNISNSSTNPYYEIYLNDISFAPSGSTASDQFTSINEESLTVNVINTNYNTGTAVDRFLTTENNAFNYNFFSNTVQFSKNLKVGVWYQVFLFYNSANINYDWSDFGFSASFYETDQFNTILPFRLETKVEGGIAYLKVKKEYFPNVSEIVTHLSVGSWLSTLSPFPNSVAFKEVYTIPSTLNTIKSTNLEISVTDLVPGAWDFRFNIQLRAIYSSSISVEKEIFYTISNVNITPEKLLDRPGDEGVPIEPHPIWSCNNVIEHFNKLMVWGSTEMKNSVFYSFPDRPGYFPSKFYLDFGSDSEDPVVSVAPYMNILVVQTPNQTWGLRGNSGYLDSPAPYTPFTINPTVGTIAPKSVRPIRNHLFFLSNQGVIALKSLYAADEQYNIEFVDLNIRNIVPQDSDAVGIQFDNQYWLNFPNYGITLRWYIDKKAWVKDTYGTWDEFNGVFKYQIINGKLEFITHPSAFTVVDANEDGIPDNLTIYKIGVDYSLPTDLFEPITSKFETSFLNQNYPFHPKNYKEAKLDFTIQNEYNLGRLPVYDSEDGVFDLEAGVNSITLSTANPLLKNHKYRIEYNKDDVEITSISLDGSIIPIFGLTEVSGGIYDFYVTNDMTAGIQLDISVNTGVELPTSVLIRDVTYDSSLNFLIQVVSEDGILNTDDYNSYETPSFDLLLNLQDQFGDFNFGATDFGKSVTVVSTVKLSGKGYNSKVYIVDVSKSKWTLESMGITFKMKRPRSR